MKRLQKLIGFVEGKQVDTIFNTTSHFEEQYKILFIDGTSVIFISPYAESLGRIIVELYDENNNFIAEDNI